MRTLTASVRAEAQGPSQVGNPRCEPHQGAESPCGNKPNLRQTDTANKKTLFLNVIWSLFHNEKTLQQETPSIRYLK
jgi:hypothetical protein